MVLGNYYKYVNHNVFIKLKNGKQYKSFILELTEALDASWGKDELVIDTGNNTRAGQPIKDIQSIKII